MSLISINVDGLLQHRLNRKRAKVYGRLRNTCLHIHVELDPNENFQYTLTLESPPGTLQYICSRCGMITTEEGVKRIERDLRYKFENNFVPMMEHYLKCTEKIGKLAKKLNELGGPPD